MYKKFKNILSQRGEDYFGSDLDVPETEPKSSVDLIAEKIRLKGLGSQSLSPEILEQKKVLVEDVGKNIQGPGMTGEFLKIDSLIGEDCVLVEILKDVPMAQLKMGDKIKLKLHHRFGYYMSDLLADDSFIELFLGGKLDERRFYSQKRNNDAGHAIGYDHYGFRF